MSFNSFGAKIKVVGVGGGGGNAVNTMIRSGLEGVDFIVANTDAQALKASLAPHKIQLGKELTKGLGAGADPDIGRDAALEDRMELQEFLSDADMVFITAGMGGGTGTGAAAVVAQIARELGALTVAVVTKPFAFEGKRRRKHGELGVARLRECVDTLITIPNQRLLQVATPDLSMLDAFKLADNVLVNAVRGISDIINTPGLINVDFADVKTVMSSMGHALMGIGYGAGTDRALSAARQAISSPLLEDVDIEGATGILINITAGTNVSIMEVNNACMVIQEAAHEDANIIFGAVIDEALGDEIRITVIATGFPVEESIQPEEVSASFAARAAAMTKPLSAPNSQRLVAPPRLTSPVSHAPSRERAAQVSVPTTPEQSLPRMTITPAPQQSVANPSVAAKTAEPVRHAAANHWTSSAAPTQPPSNQMMERKAPPAAEPQPVARTQDSLVAQATSWMNERARSSMPTQAQSGGISATEESREEATPINPSETPGADDWFVSDASTVVAPENNDLNNVQQAWDMDFGSELETTHFTTQPQEASVTASAQDQDLSLNSAHDSFGLDDAGVASPNVGKTVAEMVFASNDEVIDSRAGAVHVQDESAWDFDPPNPTLVSDEIDRRIDEALALAGQLGGTDVKSSQAQRDAGGLDLDDLELPAFLRSSPDMNPL